VGRGKGGMKSFVRGLGARSLTGIDGRLARDDTERLEGLDGWRYVTSR